MSSSKFPLKPTLLQTHFTTYTTLVNPRFIRTISTLIYEVIKRRKRDGKQCPEVIKQLRKHKFEIPYKRIYGTNRDGHKSVYYVYFFTDLDRIKGITWLKHYRAALK